ncbi:MAG: hypothetical protein WD154_01040 [Nitrosopumilaceae archaeon]
MVQDKESESKILAINEMRVFFTRPNEPLSKKPVVKIQISYDLPFGLPTSYGKDFVKIGSEKIGIEVEVKQKPEIKGHDSEKVQTPKIRGSQDMRMWNDRFGKYNYTSIRFTFDLDTATPLGEIKYDSFLNKTLTVTNRVLDAVRMVSDNYLPRNFVRMDVDAYNCECIDDEGKLVHGFGSFIVGGEGQTGKNMSNKLLEQSQLEKLQKILENDIQMRFEYELQLNAHDYLLFENYRMACIEIQNAVEYVISNIIKKDLTEKGKTEQEISEILNLRLEKLKPFLKSATTNDIFQSNEYVRWQNQCYKVRNDVIHKGKTPTPKEATDAISHGKNFIVYLEKFKKSMSM